MQDKFRVLVVDDERSVRRSLVEFLEDYDFDVLSAKSAEEALELLKNETCKVGVIDLRLPGMSGEALIQQAHKIAPDMRFIIHTGSVGYFLPDELKNIGMTADYVFLKPLPDLDIIVDAINKLMQND